MLAIAASACSSVPPLDGPDWDTFPQHVEYTGVPWFPDDPYQCGSQTLAMMLSFRGVDVRPNDLIEEVYVPGRKGSFAPELRAAARIHGLLPYRIDPSMPALVRALADGYPVLILQNVGLGFAPVWHFAATIGFDRPEGRFILRTGPYERYLMDTRKFERRWRLAEFWGIVLLGPDDFPDWIDQHRYEEQLALMEDAFAPHMEPIYRKMSVRWPKSEMMLLGLGNIAYGNGRLSEAARRYQDILQAHPASIAALNNLAEVRLDLNDAEGATELVCRAIPLAVGHPLESYVQQLRARLDAIGVAPCSDVAEEGPDPQ